MPKSCRECKFGTFHSICVVNWRTIDLCDTERLDDCPLVEVPLTNADKIRNMTDEELADFLATNQRIGDKEYHDGFYLLWLDWLKEDTEP